MTGVLWNVVELDRASLINRSVLQCVAVCCSVLQCVAVCYIYICIYIYMTGVLWNVVELDRASLINRLQRYDLSKKIDPQFFEFALNTEKRDLTST